MRDLLAAVLLLGLAGVAGSAQNRSERPTLMFKMKAENEIKNLPLGSFLFFLNKSNKSRFGICFAGEGRHQRITDKKVPIF